MKEGNSAEEIGKAGTNYRGPAILNGARGPKMLHIFYFQMVRPCWSVPKMFFLRESETDLGGIEKTKIQWKERG
jgi:hypothetical protein